MAVTVVLGSPCSGKSSYIRKHKKQGDIVIDFDALAYALGAESHHCTDGNIKAVARAARAAAIDYVVAHNYSAWVIHSFPSDDQIRWYEAHGARFVELDPGYEECMRRARADNRPSWTQGAIMKWYKTRDERRRIEQPKVKASGSW